MDTKLQAAIARALQADEAFESCVKAHGYKSRWDIGIVPQQSQVLRDAYFAKVDADAEAHQHWERVRAQA